MSKHDLVEVEVTMRRESSKSYGCDVGKEDLVWLPKSQVKEGTPLPDKPTHIKIPLWLASNEGLV